MREPWVRRGYDETRLWMRMPFGTASRAWLHDALGDRIRPEWNTEVTPRHWEIAKPHLRTLAGALADRFGEAHVYLEFSTTERCDDRCQTTDGDDCTCSCRDEYHGGGTYWTE